MAGLPSRKATIEEWAAVDRSGWSAAERSRDLLELLEASRLLDTLIRRLAVEAGEGSGEA